MKTPREVAVTQEELRRLVTRIVREEVADRVHALVLFSGASLGFDAALASLRRLRASVGLDWTQTPAAAGVLDQDAIAAVGMTPVSESLVSSHDLLIVPTTTVNLAAKLAHGIGDCLASNVAAEFVMSAKPVVMGINGTSPESPDKQGWFPRMPQGYREMLRRNLDVLRSFGVRLTMAEELDEAVRETVRRMRGEE